MMIPDLSGSLKLTADGAWYHDDHPFTNEKLIELFSRSVVWDEERSTYVLRIGRYGAIFTCEDTPYFVRELEEKNGEWNVHLSDQTIEKFDPYSLVFGKENQAYCTVKGSHRARFTKSAHQTLLSHAVSDVSLKFGAIIVTVPYE